MFSLRRLALAARGSSRKFSTTLEGNNILPVFERQSANAQMPLLQYYRSSWPDGKPDTKFPLDAKLPPRTVPDSALRFELSASSKKGMAVLYSHLPINPADYKVALWVGRLSFHLLSFPSVMYCSLSRILGECVGSAIV
jgi:hypothetical protein